MTYVKEAQYDGDSGNPGFSSNPDGVLAISAALKVDKFCEWEGFMPTNCTDEGYDKTDDIGSFEGQPPLIMLHGTSDFIIPYDNGKAAYDRAQSVDLPSTMITMEGLGHVPLDEILTTYFTDMTFSLYLQVTKGAQTPEGCHEVDEEDWEDWKE